MVQRFPEILAPVGGRPQLEAAVKAGADAVYLAGSSFGARSSAQNFGREELSEAIRYAHLHGVSVFVTVNTLILDYEMEEAFDFVDFLYRNDADAVIIQDLGLMNLIRRRLPDLPLHASTQMTFHNIEGVRYAKKLGFSRVVLPREMHIDEIKRIAEEVDIELEVFIHGALCMSYSGMCLMSSYIGGRSGNRGFCAQPCRKKYSLYSTDADRDDGRTYFLPDSRILSPKDLSAAEYLDELLAIPKISLKIEGRLKDAYYVFSVVSTYKRQAASLLTGEEALFQLKRSYNRGFTKGFLFGESITEFTSGEHPGNHGTFLGYAEEVKQGLLAVHLHDSLSKGDEVQARFPDGRSVGVRADKIERNGREESYSPAGSTVRIPWRHRVSKGAELFKTYSRRHVEEVDLAMHQEIKTWLIRAKAVIAPESPAYLRLEILGYMTVAGAVIDLFPDGVRKTEYFAEAFLENIPKATGSGTSPLRIREQLMKFGGTPFALAEDLSDFEISEGVFIPISKVNALRREALERLADRISLRYPERRTYGRVLKPQSPEVERCTSSERAHECVLKTDSGVSKTCVPGGDKSVLPTNRWDESVSGEVLELPAIIASEDWERMQQAVDAAGIIKIGHVSQLAFRGLAGKKLCAAYTVNVVNAETVLFLQEQGVREVEISPEVEEDRMDRSRFFSSGNDNRSSCGENLSDADSVSILRTVDLKEKSITLMRMAYCPVGAKFGGGRRCGLCGKYSFAIRDEKGVEFPLRLDPLHCTAEVLSPSPDRFRGKKMLH